MDYGIFEQYCLISNIFWGPREVTKVSALLQRKNAVLDEPVFKWKNKIMPNSCIWCVPGKERQNINSVPPFWCE